MPTIPQIPFNLLAPLERHRWVKRLVAISKKLNVATGRPSPLIGEIGEIAAAAVLPLRLYPQNQQGADGVFLLPGGPEVQIRSSQTSHFDVDMSGPWRGLIIVSLDAAYAPTVIVVVDKVALREVLLTRRFRVSGPQRNISLSTLRAIGAEISYP
jgi:hypothetical protein